MPNFDVQIRRDYRDMTGLVLDLRSEDLIAIEGSHTGSAGASVLTDSTKSWVDDALVGMVVHNITDGSHGVITSNTATTITAILGGGTDNDWDGSDEYTIQGDESSIFRWTNAAPKRRGEITGTHDGGDNEANLSDSNSKFIGKNLIGMVAYNVTDGSMAAITANDDDSATTSLSGGIDNDWDDGDEYIIAEPRFGDAYSEAEDYQPVVRTISGYRLIEFTRDLSTRLYVPLERAFVSTWWTAALEFWIDAGDTNNYQAILDMNVEDLVIWRRYTVGTAGVKHGSSYQMYGSDHPNGSFVLRGISATTDVDYYQDGAVLIDGTPATSAAVSVASSDDAIFIGSLSDDTSYLSGRIRTLKLFARQMSPLEIDFLYQSMAADGSDDSVQDRATVALTAWTDDVDDTIADEGRYSRINNKESVQPKFMLATVDGTARIQIAASVNGLVVPDSELSSKLFVMNWIEFPGAIPAVYQENGWSAVFDVELKEADVGHYSCMITREDGGAVIVHFDVEAA